jgi:hypothetical protein
MSHTEQTQIEELIGQAVAANVRPTVNWIRGLVLCVILGTATVVKYVSHTDDLLERHNEDIRSLRSLTSQHDKDISRIQGRLGLASHGKPLPLQEDGGQ